MMMKLWRVTFSIIFLLGLIKGTSFPQQEDFIFTEGVLKYTFSYPLSEGDEINFDLFNKGKTDVSVYIRISEIKNKTGGDFPTTSWDFENKPTYVSPNGTRIVLKPNTKIINKPGAYFITLVIEPGQYLTSEKLYNNSLQNLALGKCLRDCFCSHHR